MTRFFSFLRKTPLLAGILAFVLMLLATTLPHPTYWNTALLRLIQCGELLFLLYLISGEKSVFSDNHEIGYTFKHLKGLLIFGLVFGMLPIFTQFKNGIEAGLPLRAVSLLLMLLFACLFEELCFRAVLNDAIVYQFRNYKHVFVLSAVVSSLTFGVVHVMGAPLTSVIEWAQFFLKTISAAIMGFAFLVLYWKTRNIWAVALVHALYDILTQLSLIILGGNASLGIGSYVMTGLNGIVAIGVFSIQTVIGVLIALHVWKKVGKTIDFEAMRKTW